jgi:hypothetical protein
VTHFSRGSIKLLGKDGGPLVDPSEPLQHFSAIGCALVALVYSLITFRGDIFNQIDSPRILRAPNALPLSKVLIVHGTCLITLYFLLHGAQILLPQLPNWMTVTAQLRRGRGSFVDVLLILAAVAMEEWERKWLGARRESRRS